MILTCLPVEARVLAGMICEPDVLALCDDVESADFVDMRHVVVLYGIRAAQLQGPVDSDAVVGAIEQMAMDWGSLAMAEKVNAEFIRDLIAKAPPGGIRTIRRDTARLRTDREFRERLYAEHAKALKESRR